MNMHFGVQKIQKKQSNRGKQLQPRSALARIRQAYGVRDLLARKFELVGHRSFEWRTLRNAQASPAVALRLQPAQIGCIYSSSVGVNCSLARARWRDGVGIVFLATPLTHPQGCRLSTSFALRNSDLLPILHVGKASVKGTVWKASARTVPDPSHRFRRISALSH